MPHPFCDAPIRHIDHITPRSEGGQTSAANGQGLCERCNHAKQAPGWTQKTPHDRGDGGSPLSAITYPPDTADVAGSQGDVVTAADPTRRIRTLADPTHHVHITTPTGHHYRSP